MTRRLPPLLAVALAAAACFTQDPGPPDKLGPGGSQIEPGPAKPSGLIQDEAHNNGTKGFFFLPPLVKQPVTTGTFDATISPTVQIDEIDAATLVKIRPIATYTKTSGPGGQVVKVGADAYSVLWHTVSFDLDPKYHYRISVSSNGKIMGIADVDLLANGSQAKNVVTGELIPLLDNATLPIRFWMSSCAPVVCVASDQCHEAGQCDPATGQCNDPVKVDGAACNDGNACTQTDTCQAGSCSGANPVACTALDQCHDPGTCDPSTGACDNPAKADGAACNDGDACTQTDTCQAGSCSGSNPVACTALDQCHDPGTCDPGTGACDNPAKADGAACNDGNACTQKDACLSGSCAGADAVVCVALDQCHIPGSCDPGTGACDNPAKADGAACNDGNACTQTDTCQAGSCSGSNPVACTALDDCHVPGSCDPSSGACDNPAKPDLAPCNDGNACTQSDACSAGVCTGSNPVVCAASDACHDVGTCEPATGTCSNPEKPNGASCDDGNPCTSQDACASGACAGVPKSCDDANPCSTDTCDPVAGCTHAPAADGTSCSDGAYCNGPETCQAGSCAPGAAPCDDGSSCTADSCDEAADACAFTALPLASACSLPAGGGKCSAGFVCTLVSCEPGRADCNADAADGCETQLATAHDHCGACGLACASSEACISGTCRAIRQDLAGGDGHTCEVRPEGTVFCWGDDFASKLGNNSMVASTTPVQVQGGLSDAVAVVGGGYHSCALRKTGQVVCWGFGVNGQLGNGLAKGGPLHYQGQPVDVVGLTNGTQIAAGQDHTCAVRANGSLACWGGNAFGQLGTGDTTSTLAPVSVPGISNAVEVSGQGIHTCVRRATGTIDCWGYNGSGQVGVVAGPDEKSPVNVSPISGAVGVTTGYRHSCALLASGKVKCWGSNTKGQLGDGTTTSTHIPVEVSGLSDAVQLSAGFETTCARRATGAVVCWGVLTGDGIVGGFRTTPATVVGLSDAVMVAGGYNHTCARRASGAIACWGGNTKGQLGDGTTALRHAPVPVCANGACEPIGRTLAGGGMHTCAVVGTQVKCWGDNFAGKLGDGSTTDSFVPVTVAGLSDAKHTTAGWHHTCALRTTGAIACWGFGANGQLGNGLQNGGPLNHQPTPTAVVGIGNAIQMSAGQDFTCAVESDGTMRCWGQNFWGELGDGTTTSRTSPVYVTGYGPYDGPKAAEAACGGAHTCVRRSDATVQCWGYNNKGQLGNGTKTNSQVPVAVAGLQDAVQVVSGYYHSCARLSSGQVKCWGGNAQGELGDGSAVLDSPTPVLVAGVYDAVDVSAGFQRTCVRRASGALMCWGSGPTGEGISGSASTPKPVVGITDGVDVANGWSHTCVLRSGNAMSCWGSNTDGQLGDGTTTFRTTPVSVVGL